MRKFTFLVLILLSIVSCKDKTSQEQKPMDEPMDAPMEMEKPKHPENITKVFDAHGGIDLWNEMRSLEFSMEKPDGFEITTTDLKERYSLVEMPKHTIGFDGESVWMKSKDKAEYKGNPKFYYNLMFYFYAMPFVLADDGITYSDTKALSFEGKEYPGIKINYAAGVGESPEDEYILYYDPATNKMAWLGYTVTYFTKEKAKEWHFIKYSDWQDVEGLLMPKTLTWFDVENNLPTKMTNAIEFKNVVLTRDKMNLKMYMMPEGAEEVQ